MAYINVRIRQRSVIEFLNGEGGASIRIHERLKNVYGDAIVDVSAIRRWVHSRNEVEAQRPLADQKRSGGPLNAKFSNSITSFPSLLCFLPHWDTCLCDRMDQDCRNGRRLD
ncbi:hypothetical protein Trydic_g2685 [Trypoxylus dichotomus]